MPLGVKVQLPAQIWNAALLPEGRVERVALGAEPPRLVASMGGGERCLLVLPAVPVGGLDLLQAEVFTAMGDAALLEAALWLQPAGAAIRSEADLSLSAPDARWSGWRRSAPGGAPLRLSLTLPPGAAPMLAAVLVMRNLGAEPEDLLRVEWSELSGARLREPVAVAETAGAGPFQRGRRPAAASLPRLPAGEIPKVAQIRLQEHYETEDGGYRHLDILVIGMQAAGFTWPRLRFKLAVGGDDPVLEFRSRPDWPPMFEAWPGRQVDEHGALLLLDPARHRPRLPGPPPQRARPLDAPGADPPDADGGGDRGARGRERPAGIRVLGRPREARGRFPAAGRGLTGPRGRPHLRLGVELAVIGPRSHHFRMVRVSRLQGRRYCRGDCG